MPLRLPLRSAVLTLVTLVSPLQVQAQTRLWEFHGNSSADGFGHSVSGAGDVDADGRADLIIGAYRDDRGGAEAGSARVLSGADGSLLHSFYGARTGDRFGYSVSGVGDADGDGHDDVIVGAPGSGLSDGGAWVLSGRDGSVLHSFPSPSSGARFGFAVQGAGDVDADGRPDVIVGAPYADLAQVFSGRDGSLLHTLSGSGGEDFGFAVSAAGDVDADGHDDVIVGCPRRWYYDRSGSAYVYSGRDGALLHAFDGQGGAWIWFGYAVSGAGDVDADGHADLIVGAPSDELLPDRGSARVYSGRDGSLLHLMEAPGFDDYLFGSAVAGVGDLDLDGHDDVLVHIRDDGYLGTSPGLARVYSGRDGSALQTFAGEPPGEGFGRALAAAGDVNGDGRTDLVLGVPSAGPADAGSAVVVACCDFLGQLYCTPAIASSTGTPATLTATGSARAADNDLVLTASSLPPSTAGLFLAARTRARIPLAGGGLGVLCLGAPIARLAPPLPGGGQLALGVDLTSIPGLGPVLPGSTWAFQCAYRDAGPGTSWNLTDAVAVGFE